MTCHLASTVACFKNKLTDTQHGVREEATNPFVSIVIFQHRHFFLEMGQHIYIKKRKKRLRLNIDLSTTSL